MIDGAKMTEHLKIVIICLFLLLLSELDIMFLSKMFNMLQFHIIFVNTRDFEYRIEFTDNL